MTSSNVDLASPEPSLRATRSTSATTSQPGRHRGRISTPNTWTNRMAFDFLAVPAMSSECERVWHQECLSNWQRRGAIQISRAFNAAVIDW
ncbi:hypothetical protein NA56DRAFT_748622, partial [Hyaloscypha hepaticicola]